MDLEIEIVCSASNAFYTSCTNRILESQIPNQVMAMPTEGLSESLCASKIRDDELNLATLPNGKHQKAWNHGVKGSFYSPFTPWWNVENHFR